MMRNIEIDKDFFEDVARACSNSFLGADEALKQLIAMSGDLMAVSGRNEMEFEVNGVIVSIQAEKKAAH